MDSRPPPRLTSPDEVLSQVFTEGGSVSGEFIRQLVTTHYFDEIPNFPGAVRGFLWNQSPDPNKKKKKFTGVAEYSYMFCVYQTGRYGPQNGFRFVIVQRGYPIASATKAAGVTEEDEIDALEKPIPQGHMEIVVLGKSVHIPDPTEEQLKQWEKELAEEERAKDEEGKA
ncbi:hypothetical protein RB595_004738 [Gaeumannomyces hyphopodioides]